MSLDAPNWQSGYASSPDSPLALVTTTWERDRRMRPAGDSRTDVFATALKEPLEATLLWRQPQMSTVADVSSIIRLLECIFTFVRPQEVQTFLSGNSYLIPLLFGAREQVSKYFGQNAPTFLEVVSDPESANDKQLFALVGTPMSPQEALAALNSLDQEWWPNVSAQSQGNLVVDVKFL